MDYRPIIESKYNRQNWQSLLHDIFGSKVKFWNTPSVVSTNSQFAKQALWLGTITLSDEQTISIYEVELADSVDIERNRRGIRDMLLTAWRNNGNAGAFMFCYRKHESVLRFSYVSESWTFAEDGTYQKESTDTKRFTYLLGEGHRSRTAIQQFEKLRDSSLSLKDLTKAFSVDAVSDMFFKGYKQQYEDIIFYITGKRMVKVANKWEERQEGEPNDYIMQQFAKFPNPEKAVRDYVKKLMGRLVFLQFLQKKGWLGVPVNKEWGSGDSEFIQTLFAECKDKNHFIDNTLETLFNDLNTEREGNLSPLTSHHSPLKIPYLNGGLFERDATDETAFPLPAKYMQSLLDFFASYNFTIDENDPDDAEVGVDPEMLGRIFENLLEDNKDKGAFYTPKEIVTYMCRESLIAYLQTDIQDEATKEAIRQFVTTHDVNTLGANEKFRQQVDEALKNVKICTPAIGSGAFPMGLLKELFQCRTALEGITQSKAAEIKKHIIQQNIYGVDIERGAVDIARLRFWLSLIVDEETPQALPNLDYKIVEGNSLITTFDGQYIDLEKGKGEARFRPSLINIQREKKELQAEQKRFFTLSGEEKYRSEIVIKNHILNIIWYQLDFEKHSWQEASIEQTDLFGTASSKGRKKNKAQIIEFTQERQNVLNKCEALLKQINDESKTLKERASITIPFFEWETVFSDVFDKEAHKGFDIVIANPPYVDIKSLPNEDVKLYFGLYESTEKRMNLYAVFIERGLKLKNEVGILCFINPNSLLMNESYTKIRKMVVDYVDKLIKLPDSVFLQAIVETIIILIKSVADNRDVEGVVFKNSDKLELNSIPFSNFKREAFKNDEECRFNIFTDPTFTRVIKQIKNGAKDLYYYVETSLGITPYDKYKGHDEATIKQRKYHSSYKVDETYVPLISGGNISRYSISDTVEEYLKYGDWLGAPRERKFFEGINIVVRQILMGENLGIIAGLSERPQYFTQIGFSLLDRNNDINELKVILAILNSRLMTFYHKNVFLDTEKKVFPKILIANAKKFPIKMPSDKTAIVDAVNHILRAKKDNPSADTTALESEIDRLVYQLYGLTYDEVLIVDPKTPITREEYENQQ